MRRLVLFTLLFTTGCVATWRRGDVRARVLREHYATAGVATSRETFVRLWESRPTTIDLGCPALTSPCRVGSVSADDYCFVWGAERACFGVVELDGTTRLVRSDKHEADTTERWIYARLDPSFRELDALAIDTAELEVQRLETPPADASSFWINAKSTLQLPSTNLGLQVQAGYRRWLEHYVLVSVGGGYERSLITNRDSGMARDSILFTGRIELSVYYPGLANLPAISGYFGLTGVLGVMDQPSWTTRVFVGFSSIIPLTGELGYAVTSFAGDNVLGNFYVGLGLGI